MSENYPTDEEARAAAHRWAKARKREQRAANSMQIVSNIVIFAMSMTFILLALQAEPVTATLGWIFGILLFISLIYQFTRRGNAGES